MANASVVPGERKKILEKVVLEKTGTHVEVISGPYTKRELRELLLSSLSLLSRETGDGDREAELARLSGVDPDDLRRMKNGELFGNDGDELFEKTDKKLAALRLVNLIAKELNTDHAVENDLINLLREKGISDDLIDRILKYGLTDEIIRLLKALGLTDDEIARLIGTWDMFNERSEESCLSVSSSSSSLGYMTVEGFYLMSNFRNPLTKALADIASKKPWNPAEYLGHWLLNYKICEERGQKRKEFHAELLAERERRRDDMQSKEPNVSEADAADDKEEEELAGDDWNFVDYQVDPTLGAK